MPGKSLGLSDVVQTATAMLKARYFNKRVPLFISWHLTFRCNKKCHYCGAWHLDYPELGTSEVLDRLDQICELGARWITFSGGEVLLRDDLREIISHAKAKGIRVFIDTNGVLLPQKIDELRGVDRITLSLDGPEEVHDSVRGQGTFARVLRAIDACRDNGIPAVLVCVLAKHNLHLVHEVINIASEKGLWVMFQPGTELMAYSNDANPIASPLEEYREAIRKVVEHKKQGAPISNSLAALKHLSKWPSPTEIWCSAGLFTCCIEPDGRIVACDEVQRSFLDCESRVDGRVKDEFDNLCLPSMCSQCWCAPIVELSLISSLNFTSAWNALRTMF